MCGDFLHFELVPCFLNGAPAVFLFALWMIGLAVRSVSQFQFSLLCRACALYFSSGSLLPLCVSVLSVRSQAWNSSRARVVCANHSFLSLSFLLHTSSSSSPPYSTLSSPSCLSFSAPLCGLLAALLSELAKMPPLSLRSHVPPRTLLPASVLPLPGSPSLPSSPPSRVSLLASFDNIFTAHHRTCIFKWDRTSRSPLQPQPGQHLDPFSRQSVGSTLME